MSFDVPSLIHAFGYIGIFAIVFAESGMLIGLFLPGDSLLFTAGILAAQGYLDVWVVAILVFVAAVLGDSVGYAFGQRYGRQLFKRPKSLLFHPGHLQHAEEFFEQHGKKTIFLARFTPFVRTFAPVVAGIGQMPYREFLTYNITSAFVWSFLVTLVGYFLGKLIPHVDTYVTLGIVAILLLSIAQPVWHLVKDPEHRRQIKSWLSVSRVTSTDE